MPVPSCPLVVPAACSRVTVPTVPGSSSPHLQRLKPRRSQLMSSPLQARCQRVASSWLIRARRNEASPAQAFTCISSQIKAIWELQGHELVISTGITHICMAISVSLWDYSFHMACDCSMAWLSWLIMCTLCFAEDWEGLEPPCKSKSLFSLSVLAALGAQPKPGMCKWEAQMDSLASLHLRTCCI